MLHDHNFHNGAFGVWTLLRSELREVSLNLYLIYSFAFKEMHNFASFVNKTIDPWPDVIFNLSCAEVVDEKKSFKPCNYRLFGLRINPSGFAIRWLQNQIFGNELNKEREGRNFGRTLDWPAWKLAFYWLTKINWHGFLSKK